MTSSLCVLQPQQQGMEAFMELLYAKTYNQHLYSFPSSPKRTRFYNITRLGVRI